MNPYELNELMPHPKSSGIVHFRIRQKTSSTATEFVH